MQDRSVDTLLYCALVDLLNTTFGVIITEEHIYLRSIVDYHILLSRTFFLEWVYQNKERRKKKKKKTKKENILCDTPSKLYCKGTERSIIL